MKFSYSNISLNCGLKSDIDYKYITSSLYKASVYSFIYFNFLICFLFTVGGAVCAIPAVCDFFFIGLAGKFIIGTICALGAFLGTIVVQGKYLSDYILNKAGIKPDDSTANNQASLKQSQEGHNNYYLLKLKKIFVITLVGGNALFFIAGGYFAVLQMLAMVNLSSNFYLMTGAMFLAVVNYMQTFVLNGFQLYYTLMDYDFTSLLSFFIKVDIANKSASANDTINLDDVTPVITPVDIVEDSKDSKGSKDAKLNYSVKSPKHSFPMFLYNLSADNEHNADINLEDITYTSSFSFKF